MTIFSTIMMVMIMIMMHIISDYWLQTTCNFHNLKQISFWKDAIPEEDKPLSKSKYSHDYRACLYEHAFSWAFCIELPLFIHYYIIRSNSSISITVLLLLVVANTICHAMIDDYKANLFKINLIQDQYFHFIQIIITLGAYLACCGGLIRG